MNKTPDHKEGERLFKQLFGNTWEPEQKTEKPKQDPRMLEFNTLMAEIQGNMMLLDDNDRHDGRR